MISMYLLTRQALSSSKALLSTQLEFSFVSMFSAGSISSLAEGNSSPIPRHAQKPRD